MKIEVDDKEVLNKLDDVQQMKLKNALTQCCLWVMNDARSKCPVDIGTLRNSITYEVYDDYGEVGTNLEYAPYVEFGTGKFAVNGDGRQTRWSYQDEEGNWHSTIGQEPQPYLVPALDENRGVIELTLKASLDEVVR